MTLTGILPSGAEVLAKDKPVGTKGIISVWHWGSQTEPMGMNFVVNDEHKSSKTLRSYRRNNVNRVYGDYLRMASTPMEKERLKQWNTKLYNHQLKSIFLCGTAEWIFPEFRNEMLDFITKNYIQFNKSANLSERLYGIHLDIEVHALPEWSTASASRKRELMDLLKDTYKDVRNLLIQNGMSQEEVMADVPFWYDSIAAVGWKSEEDRNQWFNDISNFLNGITIMDYENNSVPTILERAKWERSNYKGTVEIGINSEEYKTTWKNRAQFRRALEQLLKISDGPVAVHRYVVVMKVQDNPSL